MTIIRPYMLTSIGSLSRAGSEASETCAIEVPAHGRIVGVTTNDGICSVLMIVRRPKKTAMESRRFALVASRIDVPEGYVDYIGTFRMWSRPGGIYPAVILPIHVFERRMSVMEKIKCVFNPRHKRGLWRAARTWKADTYVPKPPWHGS